MNEGGLEWTNPSRTALGRTRITRHRPVEPVADSDSAAHRGGPAYLDQAPPRQVGSTDTWRFITAHSTSESRRTT
jgi:hypothetical protein